MTSSHNQGAFERMVKFRTICILICALAAFAALAGPVRAEWESNSKPAKEQATAKALKAGELVVGGVKISCTASSLQVKWEWQAYVVSVFPFNIAQHQPTKGYDLKIKIGASTSCTGTILGVKAPAEASACVMRIEQGKGEFKQLKGGYDTSCTYSVAIKPLCEVEIPAATKLLSANSGLLSSEAENNGVNVITKTNLKGITAKAKCILPEETKTAELKEFEQEGIEGHAS